MPMLRVLNRYSEPIEIQFDAAFNPDSPYIWQPGEVKDLPQDAALFCRRKSVLKEDPVTGRQVRALLIQGMDQEFEEVVGRALLPSRGPELLDRTNMVEAARQVTFVPIANQPFVSIDDRDSVVPESHTRRVP